MSGTDVIRKKVENDDGTLTLVFYQGDVEVARTIVDRNYEIIDLQGTIPDGTVKQFYDSGKLFTEATYRNNRREGLTRIYREEDGALWIEINFKDDRAEGWVVDEACVVGEVVPGRAREDALFVVGEEDVLRWCSRSGAGDLVELVEIAAK